MSGDRQRFGRHALRLFFALGAALLGLALSAPQTSAGLPKAAASCCRSAAKEAPHLTAGETPAPRAPDCGCGNGGSCCHRPAAPHTAAADPALPTSATPVTNLLLLKAAGPFSFSPPPILSGDPSSAGSCPRLEAGTPLFILHLSLLR